MCVPAVPDFPDGAELLLPKRVKRKALVIPLRECGLYRMRTQRMSNSVIYRDFAVMCVSYRQRLGFARLPERSNNCVQHLDASLWFVKILDCTSSSLNARLRKVATVKTLLGRKKRHSETSAGSTLTADTPLPPPPSSLHLPVQPACNLARFQIIQSIKLS